MPNGALLTQEELMEWTDIGQKSKLEVWLNKNSIRYTYSKKGKIITTIAAINAKLIGDQAGTEKIEFE